MAMKGDMYQLQLTSGEGPAQTSSPRLPGSVLALLGTAQTCRAVVLPTQGLTRPMHLLLGLLTFPGVKQKAVREYPLLPHLSPSLQLSPTIHPPSHNLLRHIFLMLHHTFLNRRNQQK